MKEQWIILTALVIQVLCAFFFISDITISVLGLRAKPLDWEIHEGLEIGAAIGLLLGAVLGGFALRKSIKRVKKINDQLRVASGAFMELLDERFAEWVLTPAERDVALFVIKGMSTSEIASLRDTSEGTVKAQTNAIFRKADVSGRPQLLSHFIDDLISDPLTD